MFRNISSRNTLTTSGNYLARDASEHGKAFSPKGDARGVSRWTYNSLLETRLHRFYVMISRISWWATVEHSLLRLARGRGEAQWYREISSPAHEWPPPPPPPSSSSGRNETVWRDSYLFPPEVDWNIFYRRLTPRPPPVYTPFFRPPSTSRLSLSLSFFLHLRRSGGDARTGSANLADFFMGKMVEANFALPLKLKGRGKREFLEIQRLLGTKRYSRYIYIHIFRGTRGK